MTDIRTVISDVIDRYGQTCSPDKLDELVGRVEQAQPDNPTAYAHRLAMNWSIDQQRHAVALANAEKRERIRQAQERERQRWQETFERARSQFWATAARAREQMPDKQAASAEENFRLLYLHVFDNLSDPELAPLFPHLRRDARYQRRHRIREALLPHAPPSLTLVLQRITGRNQRPWQATH